MWKPTNYSNPHNTYCYDDDGGSCCDCEYVFDGAYEGAITDVVKELNYWADVCAYAKRCSLPYRRETWAVHQFASQKERSLREAANHFRRGSDE